MKYFDYVKVINDRKEYLEENVHKGEVGIIWNEVIIDNSFYVMFDNHSDEDWYKYCIIKIEDLEYVGPTGIPQEILEKDFSAISKYAWCIVEDGYIKNLNGDKKNKVPYDYES